MIDCHMNKEPKQKRQKEKQEQDLAKSRFTGELLMWIWTNTLYYASIIFTMGILMPFALCYRERWMAKHTFIEGKQLEFYGRGWILFLRKILWIIFGPIIIGLAIGLFFAIFGSYIGDGDSSVPLLGTALIPFLTFVFFALFMTWLARQMRRWITRHTRFMQDSN